LRALLAHLRESGLCATYACTGSMSVTGLTPPQLEGHQLVGWPSILELTAGVTDRFYL
jgi:hypothetical protein